MATKTDLPLVYDSRIHPSVLLNLRTMVADGRRFILPHFLYPHHSCDGRKDVVGFKVKKVTQPALIVNDLTITKVIDRNNLRRAFHEACGLRHRHVPFSKEHMLFLKPNFRARSGVQGISECGPNHYRMNISEYYELFAICDYKDAQETIAAAAKRRQEIIDNVTLLMDIVHAEPNSLNSFGFSL